MELQQIIGFYQLVRHNSFTKAAGATFRTQSALSQQIMKLEDELTCKLVNRISRRKFTLTPEGERFWTFADTVIREHDRLLSDMAAARGAAIGRLTMAAPFTTLYHLFSEKFRAYLKDFPRVELTILDRTQSQALDLLKNGDIDLAVAMESVVPKGFDVHRWKRVAFVLIVPDRHPLLGLQQVRLRDIAKYPLILPPKGMENKTRSSIDAKFNSEGVSPRVIMESGNVELSSRYVEAGIGISFATIAEGVKPLGGRKLGFIQLSEHFGSDHVALVLRKGKARPPHLAGFVSCVLAA